MAAGSPFGLGVSVEDAFGNLVSNSDAEVSLSLVGGSAGASLGGTATTAAVGGVATFDGLTVGDVGSPYQIQASSPGLVGASTAALSVTSAAPARLVISLQPPAIVTAGSGFSLVVSVEDAFGNPASGYDGDVSVSLEGGPSDASLSGGLSERASQGVATFSGLTIDRSGGGFALNVVADGAESASTPEFRVVPAAAAHWVMVDEPPSGIIAGQSFGFTAALEDQYGNVATDFGGPVTASLADDPSKGSLSGQVTADAVNGIATFSGLTLNRAGGGYTVEAVSGGFASSVSTAITVAAAPPSRLVITAGPNGSVDAGRPFLIGVVAVDAFGNVASGFDGTVTAGLDSNRRRSPLRGTLSARADGGQASISDATLTKTGKSYAITITSNGLTPAATSVFSVTKAGRAGAGAAAAPRGSRSVAWRARGQPPVRAGSRPGRGSSGRSRRSNRPRAGVNRSPMARVSP